MGLPNVSLPPSKNYVKLEGEWGDTVVDAHAFERDLGEEGRQTHSCYFLPINPESSPVVEYSLYIDHRSNGIIIEFKLFPKIIS